MPALSAAGMQSLQNKGVIIYMRNMIRMSAYFYDSRFKIHYDNQICSGLIQLSSNMEKEITISKGIPTDSLNITRTLKK
jgi:hypothetical protein